MELKNYPQYPPVNPSGKPVIPPRGTPAERAGQLNKVSFEELLQREVRQSQPVKLSAHAERRLRERNISLSEADFAKINQAVQQAAAKGSRDSLLLYGDLALVTSITNRTVVTAMDGKNLEEHVFTNIDSAVIIK